MVIKDRKLNISVHDPFCFRDKNKKYYLFGTHMTHASSDDLISWKMLAEGVNRRNPLFKGLLESPAYEFTGWFGGKMPAMWAPDVWYCEAKKKYMMYFCTSSTFKKSAICLAEADRASGPYEYKKTLLCSGFTEKTLEKTNVRAVLGGEDVLDRYYFPDGDYNNNLWPNAIDPNTFHDESGRFWMVYGSWSGGIFLLEVDEKTGDLIHPAPAEGVDPYFGRRLMGGGHRSMEGPFIIYDKPSGYYYLFVSFGWLAADGGYQIRLFRSKSPEGPYLDMNGKKPGLFAKHERFGVKLIGNHKWPSMERPCLAPGHNSIVHDEVGNMYLVCHRRFEIGLDDHEPRVYPVFRTADDWLTLSPFPYCGRERIIRELPFGSYYRLDHGHAIDKEICEAKKSDEAPEGVFISTFDEAGNEVLCASTVRDNRSVWYAMYKEE